MIRGLHGLFYSSEPDAARAFLRDKLELPFTDVGGGWLIFDLPEGDLGVHPVDEGGTAGTHDVSFYCDDIQGTVADLRKRGVEFTHEPQDHGYGWVTYFAVPGGLTVQLYEPKYQKKERPQASGLRPQAKKAAAKKTAAKKSPPAKKTAKPAKKTSTAKKPTKRR
jgi:catechol 2,3-dioxygenase-like lactoylglutathione lyase family enzyme